MALAEVRREVARLGREHLIYAGRERGEREASVLVRRPSAPHALRIVAALDRDVRQKAAVGVDDDASNGRRSGAGQPRNEHRLGQEHVDGAGGGRQQRDDKPRVWAHDDRSSQFDVLSSAVVRGLLGRPRFQTNWKLCLSYRPVERLPLIMSCRTFSSSARFSPSPIATRGAFWRSPASVAGSVASSAPMSAAATK